MLLRLCHNYPVISSGAPRSFHTKSNLVIVVVVDTKRTRAKSNTSIVWRTYIFALSLNRLDLIRFFCRSLFCFTRHLVCLFYWANLPRGKEHEQDSRSYARCSTLPYPDQKDQTTTPGTTCPTLCDKCAGSFTSHRIMKIEGL